jgi:hypothetical protein
LEKGDVMRSFMLLIAIAGAGSSALASAKKEAAPFTAEEIAAKIAIKNDPLDQTIQVSTYNIVRDRDQSSTDDVFLRGFLNKKTRAVTYQVYQNTSSGRGWDFFRAGSYEDKDGPTAAEIHRVGSDVSCFRSLGCRTYEDVVFDVPLSTLQWVVSDPDRDEWYFKITGESGKEINKTLSVREINAFLLKMKEAAQLLPQ